MDKLKGVLKDINDALRKGLPPMDLVMQQLDKYGVAPKRGSGIPMKFPYTFSAQIAQFPIGYYVKNNWIWKYYFMGVLVSMPVFYKISRLSNSPGNKAKWAEMKRKEELELQERHMY